MLPNELVLWLAAAGICALVFGAPRLGISLLMPAAFKWIVWPTILPLAAALLQQLVEQLLTILD